MVVVVVVPGGRNGAVATVVYTPTDLTDWLGWAGSTGVSYIETLLESERLLNFCKFPQHPGLEFRSANF